jgi:hypothetical protein
MLRPMTEGGPGPHGATGITVIDGRLILRLLRPTAAVVALGSLSELARRHRRGGALRPRLAAALPGGAAVRKE